MVEYLYELLPKNLQKNKIQYQLKEALIHNHMPLVEFFVKKKIYLDEFVYKNAYDNIKDFDILMKI